MKNFREYASHREARDVPTTSSMPSPAEGHEPECASGPMLGEALLWMV